jgi:hypothetical protein
MGRVFDKLEANGGPPLQRAPRGRERSLRISEGSKGRFGGSGAWCEPLQRLVRESWPAIVHAAPRHRRDAPSIAERGAGEVDAVAPELLEHRWGGAAQSLYASFGLLDDRDV